MGVDDQLAQSPAAPTQYYAATGQTIGGVSAQPANAPVVVPVVAIDSSPGIPSVAPASVVGQVASLPQANIVPQQQAMTSNVPMPTAAISGSDSVSINPVGQPAGSALLSPVVPSSESTVGPLPAATSSLPTSVVAESVPGIPETNLIKPEITPSLPVSPQSVTDATALPKQATTLVPETQVSRNDVAAITAPMLTQETQTEEKVASTRADNSELVMPSMVAGAPQAAESKGEADESVPQDLLEETAQALQADGESVDQDMQVTEEEKDDFSMAESHPLHDLYAGLAEMSDKGDILLKREIEAEKRNATLAQLREVSEGWRVAGYITGVIMMLSWLLAIFTIVYSARSTGDSGDNPVRFMLLVATIMLLLAGTILSIWVELPRWLRNITWFVFASFGFLFAVIMLQTSGIVHLEGTVMGPWLIRLAF